MHDAGSESPETDNEAEAPPSPSESGERTILLVEDVALVRNVVRMQLEEGGYHVIEAAGGEEALEAADRAGKAIELLLTDVMMPGVDGPELADRLTGDHPDLKVLYMSGHYDEETLRGEGTRPDRPMLRKPFSFNDLLSAVRGVLHSHPA